MLKRAVEAKGIEVILNAETAEIARQRPRRRRRR